jgi:protein TonB
MTFLRPAGGRADLLRAFASSATVHALLLGAGVAWGWLAVGAAQRPPRAYQALFLPAEEPRLASIEPLSPAVPPSAPAEPELSESEVWGELVESAEEPPEEAPARVANDWMDDRPIEIGTLGSPAEPAPAAADVLAVAAEDPGPAPPAVVEPVPLEMPPPAYPRLARRAGEEGSVLCRLDLAPSGEVVAVEVLESSGSARLDEAARLALARWRFEPRRVDGRPVAAQVLHRVTFRLSS